MGGGCPNSTGGNGSGRGPAWHATTGSRHLGLRRRLRIALRAALANGRLASFCARLPPSRRSATPARPYRGRLNADARAVAGAARREGAGQLSRSAMAEHSWSRRYSAARHAGRRGRPSPAGSSGTAAMIFGARFMEPQYPANSWAIAFRLVCRGSPPLPCEARNRVPRLLRPPGFFGWRRFGHLGRAQRAATTSGLHHQRHPHQLPPPRDRSAS
jgi:hypothetical protein